jgi:hypothetical protein
LRFSSESLVGPFGKTVSIDLNNNKIDISVNEDKIRKYVRTKLSEMYDNSKSINESKDIKPKNILDKMIFAKFESNTKQDYEFGIRWNRQNKKTSVRSFTGLVNKKQFDETHSQTIEEYLNFGKNDKNDSFSAQYGHDDLIMADISIAAFVKSNNLYANEFLKNAEFEFRRIYNDLSAEQLAIEHKIQQEQKALIEINGMTLRNHHNGLKQNKTFL